MQDLPPFLGAVTTDLVLRWNPLPQVALHVVQCAENSLSEQSTAHGISLQGSSSIVGGQALAELPIWLTIERVRLLEPVPHDLVHVLKADHVPTPQFVPQ
jgi:hypothetical protein